MRNRIILLPLVLVLVAGCAKKELILEGQRFDVRTPLDQAIPDANLAEGETVAMDQPVNRDVPIRLPNQINLSSWPEKSGGVGHNPGHLALAQQLTRIWSTGIGQGNQRRHRITSEPIIAQGMIFTLDSQATVIAHSMIGAAIWQQNLTPASDRPEDASGGGLAYADGVLYATTGFGELRALDASDGGLIWTQKLGASVTAAPTVKDGRVYVVSRDNHAWALNVKTGRIEWQQQSTPADAGMDGGASPAVDGNNVILPFSSGELVSALTKNGLRIWSVAVAGSRRGQARSNIGDITSDPVVSGRRIYAANQSGRIVAIAARDGERLWTATEGSYSPVAPVDNSVFLVSDASQLVRLDARTGEVIWAVDLPLYVKEKTRKQSYTHYGPLLAGGRLIVASSDGGLRSFAPTSGELLSVVDIPSGAASKPAIVGGVLYVLSQNGQLHAFK